MTMIERCHRCKRPDPELTYCRSTDEYLCEDCIMDLAREHLETMHAERDVPAPAVILTLVPKPE